MIETTLPCPVCQHVNAMKAAACADCREPLVADALKVKILLARLRRAQDTTVSTTYLCLVCNTTGPLTAAACADCEEAFPSDAAKVDILLKRIDPSLTAAPAAPDVTALAAKVAALTAQLEDAKKDTPSDDATELQHLRSRLHAIEETTTKAEAATVPVVDAADFVPMATIATKDTFQIETGYLEGKVVVRKSFYKPDVDEDTVEKFKDNIRLIAKLDGGKGTLVEVRGASGLHKSQRNPMVYLEHYERGNLRDLLAASTQASLPWLARLKIALQTAKALGFLHSRDVLHRDVNSFHVLLAADLDARLSGLSHARKNDAATLTNGVGDFRWAAPETMADHGRYCEKADIYSLGLVLVELSNLNIPYTHVVDRHGRPVKDFTLSDRLRKDLQHMDPVLAQHVFADHTPTWYQDLALECARMDPDQRPSAHEVVRRLEVGMSSAMPRALAPTPEVDMTIVVQQGVSLAAVQPFGVQNAYCRVSVGADSFDTPPHAGGSDPKWRHAMVFSKVNAMDMTMDLHVLYKHAFTWGGTVGKAALQLADVLGVAADAAGVRRVYPVVYTKADQRGYLIVDIKFGDNLQLWLNDYVATMSLLEATPTVQTKLEKAQSVAKAAP